MKILISIVIILGLAAVAGSVIVGVKSFDGTVTSNPYEKGLMWDQARKEKAALGMMEAGYIAAFTTGLLGGFGHCIGMCGPIVASYTFHNPSPPVAGRLLPHILYNSGRITTYTLIGALTGLTGSFINVAGRISGFQNIVAIAAGLLMIFMGISISGITGGTAWLERHNSLILRAGKGLLHKRSVWRYYPLGILFGFIPCGLSYTAFTAAAGTGSLFQMKTRGASD